MDIPVIKNIVEKYSLEDLQAAEEAMMEEQEPLIQIDGKDEGEQLTHVLAAIWIKKHMAESGESVGKAVRAYSVKVRKSIS